MFLFVDGVSGISTSLLFWFYFLTTNFLGVLHFLGFISISAISLSVSYFVHCIEFAFKQFINHIFILLSFHHIEISGIFNCFDDIFIKITTLCVEGPSPQDAKDFEVDSNELLSIDIAEYYGAKTFEEA